MPGCFSDRVCVNGGRPSIKLFRREGIDRRNGWFYFLIGCHKNLSSGEEDEG